MMVQKRKNILFKLSILTLCLSYNLIYAAEKPKTRRLYALHVGKQTFEIKENQAQNLRLPSWNQNVRLQPLDRSEFDAAGVSFQFPARMHCAPHDLNENCLLNEVLEGDRPDFCINVQKYQNIQGDLFSQFISGTIKSFSRFCVDIAKRPFYFPSITHQSTQGISFICQLKNPTGNHNIMVYQSYFFKKGNNAFVISFQDLRFNANTPSLGFIAMKKLVFSTLKIDGKKAVDHQAMFKNS